MSDFIQEGQQYTSSIHDDQLRIDDQHDYHYHSNIHRDEELYNREITKKYPVTPQIIASIPLPKMKLSLNFNKLTSFAISQVDTSNVKYYTTLFTKLAEDANQSNHQLIFSGLEEIADHVVIFNGEQNDVMDLLYRLQNNSKENQHQQIIKITI